MAINIVRHAGFTDTVTLSSFNITLPASPANGNTLFLLISCDNGLGTSQVGSVSETGATWVNDTNTHSGAANFEIWRASNVSGASTSVTINFTTLVLGCSVAYFEISGLGNIDGATSNSNASTSLDTGGVVTTAASELWIGGFEQRDPANNAPPTFSGLTAGFTVQEDNTFTTGVNRIFRQWGITKIVNSLGTAEATATSNSSDTCSQGIGAYKSAFSTTQQTITGVARIQITTTQQLTGKGDIKVTVPKTITGKTNILNTTQQTITGLGRITHTSAQTIIGVGNIKNTTSHTITGVANLMETTQRTITGKASIPATTTQTITGLGDILVTQPQTITGKSDIKVTQPRTITGKGDIKATTTHTITGKAALIFEQQKHITGKASIFGFSGPGATAHLLKLTGAGPQ